jgi:tRNA-dihydrouridine synthase
VIGNGDIMSYQQGMLRMQETGCDAVMIGRAALGNPWVFSQQGKPQDTAEIIQTALYHLTLMMKYNQQTLGYAKNHLGRYFKSMPGSAAMRKMIYDCTTLEEIKNCLTKLRIASNLPQEPGFAPK